MPFLQHSFAAPGAGEEQHILLLKAVLDIAGAIHVIGVGIGAGGTGYSIGDVVELSASGTAINGYDARFIVTDESGGVVTAIKVESCGAYSIAPDPTSGGNGTTGAGNNDLTITLTVLGPSDAVVDP